MKKWAWPAIAFFAVGALGGFIAGTEYGRRGASSTPEDIAGSLVGAMMDTISQRVSSTAARNYEAAMKSHLRNLVTAQEAHFADHGTYGSTVEQINMPPFGGVTIELNEVSTDGYRGTARHASLPNVACYIEIGSAWQRSSFPQPHSFEFLQAILRLPVCLGQQDTGAVDELVGRGPPACLLAPPIVFLRDLGHLAHWRIGDG